MAATLNELIDSGEVVLGETKVARPNWLPHQWCLFHWLDTHGQYQGQTQDGHHYHESGGSVWEVYKKPAEMVDMWRWAYLYDNYNWRASFKFYATEEKAKEDMSGPIVKIEGSRISVPKEEK